MTNDKLVLNISKINISPDSTRLKYSQDERGKQVDLTVIDSDGSTAYDLTGKKIIFSEIKDGGKIIIDDETSHFIRTADNDKIGKFTYVFVDQTYQQSGEAHFEFTTDIEHVDTTIKFDISIVNSAQLKPDNTSYVSSLIALEAHYRATISNADAQTQNLINSLTDKINQAISNGQNDIANELSDARTKLQAIQDQENKLVSNWTTELNAQKQNFANLESQWQAQSKSISDSYQAKINEINTQAQSQHDSIQAAADQQLKNNQSANDAEINSVKQQLSDELAKIEADKATAIKGVTDARDKAIQDATDKLTANLQSVQADYDSWKTSTVSDFQAKLDKLTKELATDESSQAALKQAIDSAKDAISKIKDVDFTVYVHKDDLKNYYTKAELDPKLAEADQKLGQKITFVKCDSPQAAHDASMRPAADGSIVFGVYDMNDEPSQAVVGDQKINIEWLYNHLNDLSTQVSGLSSLQSLINGKANSVDVYTKSDTDNIVNILKESIANAGKVKTVNNVQPDSNGNISISIPDISGKADKTDVNNCSNHITALEVEIADLKKSGIKLVAVTQAQYDALKDKDPNVIYAIGG